ncbi:choice-of-anchor P family protein [Actinomadura sp. 6N118]|uniref:choice-of-anchor P family protein n=1 Tax=Actinomadura sp. 6N118 TaxID=3375151 RepID=UPI00379D6FFE
MSVKHLARAAVIVGAAALPLAGTLPSAQATTTPSQAFAVSASGPVAVPATPSVTSSGPSTVSRSVAELPANPVLQARVLNAAAGKAHARASVVDLKVPRAHLTASLVTAKCVKGQGRSQLVKVQLNGTTIKAAARPNSGVSVNLDALGTASLVLNKQTRTPDGRLNVTAIELTLPLGPGKTETISIASATCGNGADGPSDPGKPEQPGPSPSVPPSTPPSTPPPGQAPAPTPVPGDLPVTG